MYTWEDQVEMFNEVKHIKFEIFREYAAIHYKLIIDKFRDDEQLTKMLLDDYEDCLVVFSYLTNGNVEQALRKYSSLDTASRDKVFNILEIVYKGL